MRISFIILMILWGGLNAFSQSRIILNNNPYMVMNGSVFLVVDNANTNAVTTTGTGGNIVSENENSKVRWRIGTATGSYVLPWYSAINAGGMKIPFTFNITAAGAAGTHVDFSTYRTADNNTTYPSYVTHMLDDPTGTVDNSLNVVDRFWIFETSTYTTKPTVSMTFTYDNSATEIGAPNTITEANLVAQRFRTSDGTWGGISYGSATPASRTVGPFAISPVELHESWTLTNNTLLLPVELINYKVNCEENGNVLQWTTASESNNSHFLIYRSLNGIDYSVIGQVNGSGNSLIAQNYFFNDPYQGDAFYRLVQVDYNNTTDELGIEKSACFLEENNIYSYQSGGSLNLSVGLVDKEDLQILLFDMNGKLIYQSKSTGYSGTNFYQIPMQDYASGSYLLRILGNGTNYQEKIIAP